VGRDSKIYVGAHTKLNVVREISLHSRH
jgi:hypothetical protein